MLQQTQKDMVNAMLSAIGGSTIQQIDLSHPDVQLALDLFDENSLSVQGIGWWFNTEVHQLVMDARTGEVFLPPNTISIDNKYVNVVKRGRVLYNIDTFTTIFPSTTTAAELLTVCVRYWELEELPPLVYMYVLLKTKLAIVNDRDAEPNKIRDLEIAIQNALVLVQREQLEYSDPNNQQVGNAALMLQRQPIRRVI